VPGIEKFSITIHLSCCTTLRWNDKQLAIRLKHDTCFALGENDPFTIMGDMIRMDVRIIKVESSELIMAESVSGGNYSAADLR